MGRCKAKTRTGDQCRNNAISGTDHCYIRLHGAGQVSFVKRASNYSINHWLDIVSLILGILALIYYFQDKNIETFTGSLKPPENAKGQILAVGVARFIIDSPDNVFLREGDQPLLSLKIENGKLLVGTIIRNSKGEIIAELSNNEWKLNRDSIFDRNYNDNALEVRDKTGNIVLQVVNFGYAIHFAGIFQCKNGRKYAFIPKNEFESFLEMTAPGEELKEKIRPIFEYPSELHFGSCPGIGELEELVKKGSKGYILGKSLEICK